MKVRLGYVSISLAIDKTTASSKVTYAHYKKLDTKAASDKLHKVISSNISDFEKIINYNIANNIHFYRLTSSLFPLDSLVKIDYNLYKNHLMKIGNIIKENNMKVTMHPNQFCVLNSINPSVVASSIIILNNHKNILKLLGIDSSLVLHVGSGVNGKEESINRFIYNFNKLDASIKKLIIIENDDKIFNVEDILNLCNKIKRPMALDYHHHMINYSNSDINVYLPNIFNSWEKEGQIPKMHFSSSKSKLKNDIRSHNDYINVDDFIKFIEIIKKYNKDVDIMIEAKKKDEALFRLIRQLKYKTDYQFIDDTTFEV